MKIKMLRSKLGSNDGVTTKLYQEDEEYEVSEALGQSFIDDAVAEKADGDKKPAYKVGEVYEIGEETFLATTVDGQDEPALKPIPELTDEQRTALITSGKLGEDGKAIQKKAKGAAPQNKAILTAPQNKAAK